MGMGGGGSDEQAIMMTDRPEETSATDGGRYSRDKMAEGQRGRRVRVEDQMRMVR